jgi:hypothetical protein
MAVAGVAVELVPVRAPEQRVATASHAGAGPSERRRSSVLVVTLGQHRDKEGAAAVATAVSEQLRLTLLALGLALLVAPFAAAIEPFVALTARALPNYAPSAPCQGFFTERRSVDCVVLGAISFYLCLNAGQVTVILSDAANRARAYRFLWHSVVVGAAAAGVFLLWYSSATSSPSIVHAIALSFVCGGVVWFAPFFSFACRGLVVAKRRSYTRAALDIAYGACISVSMVMVGLVAGMYIALSDKISGLQGVTINGTCELMLRADNTG